MGNNSGKSTNTLGPEFGRIPNDIELMILFKMQQKYFTPLNQSSTHLNLLERYWDSRVSSSRYGTTNQFEIISPIWKDIGFSTDSPFHDIHWTGQLGLECIVYFVENYPGESRLMTRQNGYYFVKAGVTIVRALCEILHIIDQNGEKGNYPVMETLYWQILISDNHFYQLFCLCFVLFDELYCDIVKKNILSNYSFSFPRASSSNYYYDDSFLRYVAELGKNKLSIALNLAPKNLQSLQGLCHNGSQLFSRFSDTINHSFFPFIYVNNHSNENKQNIEKNIFHTNNKYKKLCTSKKFKKRLENTIWYESEKDKEKERTTIKTNQNEIEEEEEKTPENNKSIEFNNKNIIGDGIFSGLYVREN